MHTSREVEAGRFRLLSFGHGISNAFRIIFHRRRLARMMYQRENEDRRAMPALRGASLRYVQLLCAAVVGLLATFASAADAPARPNILYIMSDDHAYHAMSCYGSVVNQTPNIDRIAKEGALFDKYFVTNSICTPARAVILTGKYSHLNGVTVFNSIDPKQPTVSKYLQQAGYYTGIIGKWHLGTNPVGFDSWTILPGQGVYENPAFITAEGRKVINGYCTEIITDLGKQFLDSRPKDKPFFLMLHHKAPHRPWEPNAKYKAEFAKKTFPEPVTLRDDYSTRTDAIHENKQRVFDDLTRRDLKLTPPDSIPAGPQRQQWLGAKPKEVEIEVDGKKKTLTGEELNRWKYQRYMQDYLACIQSVDDSIGEILDYLDKHDLAKNTIIMYSSDQGFYLGDHGMYDKRWMYEESLKDALVVRWPGVTKPGSKIEAMSLNVDLAPTFLAAAGAPIPADMQGHSLLPVLKGETPADWRHSIYYRYYHDPGDHNTARHMGVRTETHKLIYFWKKDQWELYDLVKDPHELNNVYNDPAYAKIRDELKGEMYRLKKELKDEDQFADKPPADGVDAPVRPKQNKK
jgi:arylsulfatase A-like enzyme